MVTVTVEKKYGAATLRARVSAATIERAVELAGENSRVEFPIEGETFFATQRGYPVGREGVDYEAMDAHTIELAVDAGLPGAYEAYLWCLMEVLDVEDAPAEDLPAQAAPAA